MGKFELHVHTRECDLYAVSHAADIVKLYHDAGYEGLVITDHYFEFFSDWFADELVGLSARDIAKRRLKGYYEAKNEGEKLGFTVLAGAEVRFDGTINDYLVYGADEEFFLSCPVLNELKNLDELKSVLPSDALIVQAHPFRNKMTVCDPTPLFGIEVYNGGTEPFRNEMAEIFASHYEKAMTSGSDFHSPAALGRGGIFCEKKIKTPKDLVDVLKSGDYRLIKGGKVT
ncbi:MAG: PHP domain-containing protein [Clostridia bacterium]|nr:PHP domain-containing protein [Clostridia bacterium]